MSAIATGPIGGVSSGELSSTVASDESLLGVGGQLLRRGRHYVTAWPENSSTGLKICADPPGTPCRRTALVNPISHRIMVWSALAICCPVRPDEILRNNNVIGDLGIGAHNELTEKKATAIGPHPSKGPDNGTVLDDDNGFHLCRNSFTRRHKVNGDGSFPD